jgi:hypothetical protein
MKVGASRCATTSAAPRASGRRDAWVDAVNQLTEPRADAWCEALANAGSAPSRPRCVCRCRRNGAINRDGLPVIAAGEHRHGDSTPYCAKAVTYLQFCVGLCGGFRGGARLDAMR